jgi:predicted GIY-YIG superfamily endonuclease
MSSPKRFVYILKSEKHRDRYYTGLTSDVASRLLDHNAGNCKHTPSGRPWQEVVSIHFSEEPKAIAFERYLKSGSGCAFAERHLR